DLHALTDRLQDGRAPVGTIFPVFQVFEGQRVAQVRGQVAEQGDRQAVGAALVAVDVAVALAVAVVQAHKVARIEAAAKGAVDAEGDLRFVVAAIAQAAIEYSLLAAGQLRDVIDRATYRAGTIKECRGAADQFDA